MSSELDGQRVYSAQWKACPVCRKNWYVEEQKMSKHNVTCLWLDIHINKLALMTNIVFMNTHEISRWLQMYA